MPTEKKEELYLGKFVTFVDGDYEITGEVTSVDSDGFLIIEGEEGDYAVSPDMCTLEDDDDVEAEEPEQNPEPEPDPEPEVEELDPEPEPEEATGNIPSGAEILKMNRNQLKTLAKEQGIEVQVSKFPWAASGRALTLDRTDGVTKILADPETGKLLGVAIAGPGAGDLISEASLALETGATVADLARTIHPHPTLSETLGEAAELHQGLCTHLYRPKKD